MTDLDHQKGEKYSVVHALGKTKSHKKLLNCYTKR